jgi:hypothetical protein
MPLALAPIRRSLAAHLERLRHALDGLRERLHEAVADAVGQAAAGFVADAVHGALSDRPAISPLPERRTWSRDPPPLWREDDRQRQDDHGFDRWPDADRDEYDEPLEPSADPGPEPTPPRCCLAVAVGCQAAAWWLRRQKGRHPVLTGLSIGLACGVAAYFGGPLAAAAAALAGSALRLSGLADRLQGILTPLTWPISPPR